MTPKILVGSIPGRGNNSFFYIFFHIFEYIFVKYVSKSVKSGLAEIRE